MRLPEWLCFHLARYMRRKRNPGDAGDNPASYCAADYEEHRSQVLRDELDEYFSSMNLSGLDVLDFGCGHGGLCAHVARKGAAGVVGVDLVADLIASAREMAERTELPIKPQFILADDERTIDVPHESIDVILCFGVLEHVMEYEAIIAEWRRILRAGGRVLIHWVPWWNPYGPHIESLVPIPWPHVFFAEQTLLNTCARMYDSPDFVPKHWDLDEAGRTKPNKWRVLKELPELNRLSIRRFEKTCSRTGLTIERRRIIGFGGAAARFTRVLTRIPAVRELFTSHTVYELRKPA